ncbi:MAG: DUF2085 domain-containing protein [Chloroflexi bacterium]|nr:DUF2085 domain-containing protein [Chloroflexota bacterium]
MESFEDRLRERISEQERKTIRRKRFQVRLLENWWLIAVGILAIYVGLPIAAPVMMKVGATGPASAIYSTYSFMCHQFSFRSIFLFGEQPVYPREMAGTNYTSFEQYAAQSDEFIGLYLARRESEDRFAGEAFTPDELNTWSQPLQLAARDFKGDEQMGYKVALCQRDIAIYVAMVIGGLAYGPVRRRLRAAPLWLYVLLGLGPIGLDGFSQLLSYPPFEFWDPRETTPAFRVVTGALFGFMNVWLAFPYINESMQDSADQARRSIRQMKRQMQEALRRARFAESAD